MSFGTWRDVADARWIAQDEWVLDSMYGRHRAAAVERADVVIGLDHPRLLSLSRLARRTATGIVTQQERCNGNTESLLASMSSGNSTHLRGDSAAIH